MDRESMVLSGPPDDDAATGAIKTRPAETAPSAARAQLIALNAIALIVAGVRAPAEAIPELLRTLCCAFDWCFGVLWTFDAEAGTLRCAALWADERLCGGALAAATRERSLQPGMDTPGRTWTTRQPHWITDVSVGNVVTRNEDAYREGLRADIALPICIGGEPFGVLELWSRRVEPRDDDLLAMLGTVATLLGQHLRAARLEEGVRGGTGTIFGAPIVAPDITERRRAEYALRRSEERYRSLVQASTAVVWHADADGKTFEPSPSWEAYTGQRYPGGLGWTWLDMIHRDDCERLRGVWAKARARPSIMLEEVRVWNAASGRYRHCVVRGVPLFNAHIQEWVGTITDVDEQRRAERAARLLSDATALLAGSLDHRRTLEQVARLSVPELADVCSVHLVEDDALHMIAAAYADPSIAPACRGSLEHPSQMASCCGVMEVVRTGRTRVSSGGDVGGTTGGSSAELQRCGGRSSVCVPLCARGQNLGAICFASSKGAGRRFEPDEIALCEEIARRAAIAIDNARLCDVARRAAVAREDFMIIAAHELRTPLVPLRLGVQSLLRRARAEGAETMSPRVALPLCSIERSTERLCALVEDLLDISRLSAERFVLTLEPVDLAAVVAEVVKRSAKRLAVSRCDVRVAAEGATTGRWDRTWLEKAFDHLLSNAAKYGHGSPIELGLEGKPETVRLTVRDHGPGIPSEEQARVFERFERAVSARHYGGFGLGLWSVRKIIEAHGGSVHLQSRPGEGATFTIELPRGAVAG